MDNEFLEHLLSNNLKPDTELIKDILAKASEKKGLDLNEVALLLKLEDPELINQLYQTAYKIKQEIYGNRIVIFVPLYLSNECSNICEYCGFRADNKGLLRRTLSIEEIKEETKILISQGHKRLLLVYGEHPRFDGKWIAETVNAVYSQAITHNNIRRVNINSAPLSIEDFKIVKEAGIGTYQCFQETYHRDTYKKMHLKGKKRDYDYRLLTHDKAFSAGLDDVGLGVLFGLYDWRFELLALIQHSQHLENNYGIGPHTISFPRIEPALNAPVSECPPFQVSDEDLKMIVAVLRIAIPYTGIILTTRENIALRNILLKLGVSQISAGSKTYPGAYHDEINHQPDKQQFTIGDTRSLDEVIKDLSNQGFIPSFCTSCYRKGRTGYKFMNYAKPGNIHKFCQPNAILTYLEYILDFASPETKQIGLNLIKKEIAGYKDSKYRKFLLDQYDRIINGERDLIQ